MKCVKIRVFSTHILSFRTESTILSLYRRMQVSEKPYSCTFYAVWSKKCMQEKTKIFILLLHLVLPVRCTSYYACKSVYHFLIPCTLLHLMITNRKLCCQQFISISCIKFYVWIWFDFLLFESKGDFTLGGISALR